MFNRTIINELQDYKQSVKFKENLEIDFPTVNVSLDCIELNTDGNGKCNVRIEFKDSELLADRLHYYMIGYTAHKING